MPQIRIDDETYVKLKDAADLGKRTVGQHISFLLENEVTFQEIKALIKKEGQNPEKNLSSQANNDEEIRSLIEERRRLVFRLRDENLSREIQEMAVENCWSDEQAEEEAIRLRAVIESKANAVNERLKALGVI